MFTVTVKTATAVIASYALKAASAPEAIKAVRALVKQDGFSRKHGTLHFRARKGSDALRGLTAPKAKRVRKAKSAPKADAPMTELEFALFDVYAHCEMNSANGATPESADEIWTYLWADERASALKLTEQQVGGLLTSLVNKGFAKVIKPSKGDKDGSFNATPEGFAAWASMRG